MYDIFYSNYTINKKPLTYHINKPRFFIHYSAVSMRVSKEFHLQI